MFSFLRSCKHPYILEKTSTILTLLSNRNVQGLADYTGNDIRSFVKGFSSSSLPASMIDVGDDPDAVTLALTREPDHFRRSPNIVR